MRRPSNVHSVMISSYCYYAMILNGIFQIDSIDSISSGRPPV